MKVLRFFAFFLVLASAVFCQGPTIAGCPAFPANNIWNTTVDTVPVHARSADYIANIGPGSGFRYDATMPINIVPGMQPKVPLMVGSPTESDPGPYPIPPDAKVEIGDGHVIVVDRDNCILYETYDSTKQSDGSWSVASASKWDLRSHALRPAGWTSGDAAGLPILPGLLRYDEVASGEIKHALRFTAPTTQRLYVWPGRHYASYNASPSLPPMAQRFRLKAGFDISGFPADIQVILRAMKKYGLMLADNGLPWFLQAETDSRWNTANLDLLRSVVGANIEAVDVSGLMVDVDSGQAIQPAGAPATVTVSPTGATLSRGAFQQFTATVVNSASGVVWSMNPLVGTLSANGLYTAPATLSVSQIITITATLTSGGASGSATVTLQPPSSLANLALSTGTLIGGSNVIVTASLTSAAPAGGAAVTLSGSNPAFPTTLVTIAAGSASQAFSVPTSMVSSPTALTITGAYGGGSATAQLTLNPVGTLLPAVGPTIAGCPAFPVNNIWNTPVDLLQVHARSAEYIASIGSGSGFRYDATMPINIVPGTQPKVPLLIGSPTESDPGPYPIPPDAKVEIGDGHVTVVDRDNCVLYETYSSFKQPDGSWSVSSASKWDLRSHTLRPEGWTSGDAAGLPIVPGLLRYDEVASGEIKHALRFTAPTTQRLYVWPGRHYASYNTSPSLPPMAQRFRLKAGFDISGFPADIQVILRAMKKYGLMLADNGLPWFLQAETDSRWNAANLDLLRSVVGANIEAVDVSGLMINANSGEAIQPGGAPATVVVSPGGATLSGGASQQFAATVANSSSGVIWSMNPLVGTLSASGLYTAPLTVSAAQTITITATLTSGAASGSATITLQPAPAPSLSSLVLSTGTVVGGNSVGITATLTSAAPAGGAAVTLSGSNAAFPSTVVTIPGGVAAQTFSVLTSAVAATTAVTITGSYNGGTASAQLTVNPVVTTPPPSGSAGLWGGATPSPLPFSVVEGPVTLGVKFRSDVAGTVTGIRFYKGSSANNGSHIGLLYTATGQVLAQAAFSGETTSGWQTITFASPVAISANTTYVAAYWSTTGYSYTYNFFTSAGLDSGSLHAPKSWTTDGGNGVYIYGSSPQLPRYTSLDFNYWVDVVFTTGSTSTPVTPPPSSSSTGLWGGSAPSTQPSSVVEGPVTLGVKFRSDVTGTVSGIRFYKSSSANNGSHIGLLYTATGQVLAQAAFSGETTSGWQTVTFSSPVAIAANTTYVAAFWSTTGYSYTYNFFTSAGLDSGSLHAPKSWTTDGGNGVYIYGSSPQLPQYTSLDSNYWVDVVFTSGSAPPPPPPPSGATGLWNGSAPSTQPSSVVEGPVTLGMKFRSDVAGTVTGLRFYKGSSANNGSHTGLLYSATGQILAQANFSGETSSGWQTVTFSTPVAISANTTYIAAFWSTTGYSYTYNFFTSAGLDNGSLHAPKSWTTDGGNGVYAYGTGPVLPQYTSRDSNYWVDVVFTP